MPIYDFLCSKCQNKFEEIVKGDDSAACPACGGAADKLPSIPGPAKTGPTPFPYKTTGAVHPIASRMGGGCGGGACGGGGCGR